VSGKYHRAFVYRVRRQAPTDITSKTNAAQISSSGESMRASRVSQCCWPSATKSGA